MELGVKESNLVLKPFDPTAKIEIVLTDSHCLKPRSIRKFSLNSLKDRNEFVKRNSYKLCDIELNNLRNSWWFWTKIPLKVSMWRLVKIELLIYQHPKTDLSKNNIIEPPLPTKKELINMASTFDASVPEETIFEL